MTKDNKDEKDKEKTRMKSRYAELPRFEGALYVILWATIFVTACFQTFYISKKSKLKFLSRGYLDIGWISYLKTYKDISDYEWSFWNKWFWEISVKGYCGHFVTMRLADIFLPSKRFHIAMVYGMSFCVYFFGWFGLAYMLAHYIIIYLAAAISKNSIVCWITAAALIYSFTNKRCVNFIKSFYEDADLAYTLMFSTAMCNLRYIAFSLEYIWQANAKSKIKEKVEDNDKIKSEKDSCDGKLRKRKNKEKIVETVGTKESSKYNFETKIIPTSFLHLLMYEFYFPLCLGGPVVNYDKFCEQITYPPMIWNKENTLKFLAGLVRHLFWQVFIEFVLHYMYFCIIQYEWKVMEKMPIFAFCGMGLCHVQFFCLKYIVMYGLPSHFSTSDNLEIPGGPHCVSGKHRFTDMWRLFDKGLHKWLVRYIFIPLGGSKGGLLRSTLSSFLPFLFVFYWHGATRAQGMWAGLNWMGVYIEGIAAKVSKTETYKKTMSSVSPATERRLTGVLYSFLFGMLIVSNLYFLSGVKGGNLYMKRVYTESLFSTFIIHLVLYCGVQSSMELSQRFGI